MQALLLAVVGAVYGLQNRPIIAVLTQPTNSVFNVDLTSQGTSFIPASYVKWLESGGARVLPIPFDANQTEITASFEAANGLLLTGGNTSIFGTPYATTVHMLLDLAVNSSRMGNPFPVWGTCQGFEELVVYFGGNQVLDDVDAEALFLPLEFSAGAEQSPVLGQMSPTLLHQVANNNLTVNLHNKALLVDRFMASDKLQSAFQLLATNEDRSGKRFVSLIAGRELPFFGSQFHPEKNSFEWDQSWDSDILQIHSVDAGVFSHQLSAFFVNQTRFTHNIANPGVNKKLVYNFISTYTSMIFPNMNMWEQTYFFSPPPPPPFYRPCTCDQDCGLVWATGCDGAMICTNPAPCSCSKCPCICD